MKKILVTRKLLQSNEDRLKEALLLGADYIINPSKVFNIKEEIRTIIGGDLLDLVIECSGSVEALQSSLDYIKNDGLVRFVTHPKYGEYLRIDPFELILGKRIEGSWGGGVKPDEHFPIIAMKSSNNSTFCNLFSSKKYDLVEINDALDDLRYGKTLRPIIKFSST